jgi:CRP-like cAMP-binding protein
MSTLRDAKPTVLESTLMFAAIDVSAEVEALHAYTRQLAQTLYGRLSQLGVPREVGGGVDVLRAIEPGLLMIEEGYVRLSHSGRTVRFFGEGDLLLIAAGQPCHSRVAGEFLTRGLLLPSERFVQLLAAEPALMQEWHDYQDAQFHLMSAICALYATDDQNLAMSLRKCASGELLVRQGERLREVLVLIDGAAEVSVDGVCIGHVTRGEFIGEMSLLTDAPCAATVVASQQCLLQVIDQDSFAAVIRSRPHTMVALARTLAERLVRANRLSAELTAQSQAREASLK